MADGSKRKESQPDPLDVPWEDLATPAGAPAPNEKRRQRRSAAQRRAATRTRTPCQSR